MRKRGSQSCSRKGPTFLSAPGIEWREDYFVKTSFRALERFIVPKESVAMKRAT